jgi:hypothetical protein
MATQDVRFIIAVEDAGAIRKLTETEQALYKLQKTGKQTGESFGAFGGEWKRLVSGFATGQFLVDGIKRGFGFLKDAVVDSIQAAMEAEKANRGLESAIAIVGEAVGGTARSIENYAEAMMLKTIYDDEAIKNAQALIIQMRGTTSGITDATRGAIGLAAVFGMDLNSAARAVAQGMEGNYRQLGMLIPAVKQAKTDTEKYAAMMKALGEYYQRAEDEAKTFGGQLTQFKNTYTELLETLGKFATSNELVIASLNSVKQIIQWINDNAKGTQGGILSLLPPPMVQGLALLVKMGADADESSKRMAIAKTTLADYTAVVWNGLDALKAFNPYLTAFVGRFDVAPAAINATATALDRVVLATTKLEQNKSRSGWLAALGGQQMGIGQTAMPSSFSTNQDVWKKQFEWLGITTKKTTDKMSDYFAGLFNDIATGFGNALAGFKFSLTGIKDFFIDIWEMIKQAFFRIIGQMIAKWVIFKAITGALNFFVPGLGSAFSAAAGLVKAASGFEGVVNRPTLFLGGEAGPERVSIRPMAAAGAGGGGMVLNFNSPLISTTGLSRADLELAGHELVRVINSQLRRVGRSI